MAAKNARAIKTDKWWHASLLRVLDGMLTDDDVRKLKQFLGSAEILSRNELAKCGDFFTLWDRLERAGKLAVNYYDELSDMMELLKRMDCVGVINNHKDKTEDYLAQHKLQATQSEELTSDTTKQRKHLKTGSLAVTGKKLDNFRAGQSDDDSLVGAAKNGDSSFVLQLLSEGVDANEKDKDGWTAGMIASYCGHLDVLDAVLKSGADIDVEDKDGFTALMGASIEGHINVIDVLLKVGADIDKKDKHGNTALILASDRGHFNVVDVLIRGEAEIDKQDKDGGTALMAASLNGHLDVVNALVKRGADIDKADKHGNTAMKLCEENGHTKIVALLRKYGAKR